MGHSTAMAMGDDPQRCPWDEVRRTGEAPRNDSDSDSDGARTPRRRKSNETHGAKGRGGSWVRTRKTWQTNTATRGAPENERGLRLRLRLTGQTNTTLWGVCGGAVGGVGTRKKTQRRHDTLTAGHGRGTHSERHRNTMRHGDTERKRFSAAGHTAAAVVVAGEQTTEQT